MADHVDLNLTDNPTAGSISRLTSEEAMLQLSYDFGGKRIYLPQKIGEHHPIACSIGLEQAKKICDAWGGMDFDVPICAGKRKRAIELRDDGVSVSKIAHALNCTERHVYRIFAKKDQDTDQLSLI